MPDGRETFSLEEFIAAFTWDRVVAGGPIFDLKRLDDLNGQYIRMLAAPELSEALEPFLPESVDRALLPRIVPLVQTRLNRLAEFMALAGFFFVDPVVDATLLTEKNLGLAASVALLRKAQDLYAALDPWDTETLEQQSRALAEAAGVKMRQLAEVVRVASTGSKAGPPLFESMEILGRAVCLDRITRALRSAPEKG
jgi:glutamyl-tRNA synthetase